MYMYIYVLMEEPLINALAQYFKLKTTYEQQFVILKTKIRKTEDLSKVERQRMFKNFNPKCVNCKKSGGTLFSNKNRVLKASCGSTSEPCKLDIEINLGKYANIINLDENYSKNMDTIKTKIILTKLDFLFGYIENENAAFENFDELRKNIENYTKAQDLIQKRYNEIAHNPAKKKTISKAETQLYTEISELKHIYKLYQENPKISFIKEMVEKYVSLITPLLEEIQKNKYVINTIEVDNDDEKRDNIMHLVQNIYTLGDLEQEVYDDIKSGVVKNVA